MYDAPTIDNARLEVDGCTGIIDFDGTAVGDLFEQSQKRGLKIPQTRLLVIRPNLVDSYRSSS